MPSVDTTPVATLLPGYYLLEVCVDRPLPRDALADGLRRAGLTEVLVENDGSTSVGALPSLHGATTSAPHPALPNVATRAASATALASLANAANAAPASTQLPARPGLTLSQATRGRASLSQAWATAPVRQAFIPLAPAGGLNLHGAGGPGLQVPGRGGGGGGSVQAQGPTQQTAVGPDGTVYTMDPKTGYYVSPDGKTWVDPSSGQAYGPPGSGPNEAPLPGPAAGGASQPAGQGTGPVVSSTTSTLADGGQPAGQGAGPAPAQQGQPAGQGAGGAASGSTSAVPSWIAPLGLGVAALAAVALIAGEAPGTYVHRVVVRASSPLTLHVQPGWSWSVAHPLSFDPYAPAPKHVAAFPLVTGAMYDLKFFSRDKRARSRSDVAALLGHMGFHVQQLLLMGRNRRIPARPLISLSEWLAVGTWTLPSSLVTADDPFLFAEVRPVAS